MDNVERPGIRLCKPVLNAAPHDLEGIRYLHIRDAKYTQQAIHAAPKAIRCWYRLISLFVRMVTGEYECPKVDTADECTAKVLRFHFGASALETSKQALDLTLSGHYTQAYGLLRNMIETWAHMVDLRLSPIAARQWMGQGAASSHEPRFGTAAKRIRRKASASEDLHNLKVAENMIKDLNQGSHPSRAFIQQLRTRDPGVSEIGGHFDLELLISSLGLGFAATSLAVHETGQIFPQPMDWRSIMAELSDEISSWQEEVGVSALSQ